MRNLFMTEMIMGEGGGRGGHLYGRQGYPEKFSSVV